MADIDDAANPPTEELCAMSLENIQTKYRAVSVGGAGQQGTPDSTIEIKHPVDFLHAIEQDPRIAPAVQKIQFQPSDGEVYLTDHRDLGWDAEWHGIVASKVKLDSLHVHPIDMIDAIGLTADEKNQWKDSIDIGGQSPSFAVLLTKLTNLQSIELVGHGKEYKPYLDKIFKHASTTPGTSILAKLTEAYICHNDTEGCEIPETMDELIFIPSLRKLRGSMLGAEYGDAEYESPVSRGDDRVSFIEEIDLYSCGMNHKDVAEFLKPLANLLKLDFDCYLDGWRYIYSYDCDVQTFRAGFNNEAGERLQQRDLVWKANESGMKIRKKDLNDNELDDYGEGKHGGAAVTRWTEEMPDGTIRYVIGLR